jgi:transcriptional regulator of acetoin/glycerol metabolism
MSPPGAAARGHLLAPTRAERRRALPPRLPGILATASLAPLREREGPALLAHPRPGNVRELRNAIERALAFSPAPDVLQARPLRFAA